MKSGNFSHWRWHEIFTKRDLQFPKPYQVVKNEKHETFFVSKHPIWCQKWVAGIRHGNSIAFSLSNAARYRVIVVLCETKYAVPRQIKSGIPKLISRRGQSNFSVALFLLAAKKKASIVLLR